MIKPIMLAVGLVLVAGIASADPGVLNDPKSAGESIKEAIGAVNPSGDALFDVDGQFRAGASIKLYSAEKLTIPVLNDLETRIGWMETQGLYGTLSINLEKATGQELLKYCHVGWYAGVDFGQDGNEWSTGPVVGVKASF